MPKVRIIAGTYGRRVRGIIRPAGPGECCDVSFDEAYRLIRLGVAEFADEPEAAPVEPEKTPDEPAETTEPEESAADYSDMTINELRQIAKDRGITGTARKNKGDLIEILLAFDAEADDDGEEPPELSAEVPQ